MPESTFTEVCELLEKVQNTKAIQRKEEIFKEFLTKCKVNECFMYPFIRLVIPNLDNYRPKSGLHVNTLGKMYVKILNIGNKSKCYLLFKNISSQNFL